jgi:hypothetical protein
MNRVYHVDGTIPKDNSIFVFGSNNQGIHGAGAAKIARELFGAKLKIAKGLCGQSYAIPTRNMVSKNIFENIELPTVKRNIEKFVIFTIENKEKSFYLTRVACGLAGYHDSTIAPLFYECGINCSFPRNWKKFLEPK